MSFLLFSQTVTEYAAPPVRPQLTLAAFRPISKALIFSGRFFMPIFEYTCNDCGRKFDELVLGGETPACPKCGSQHVTKIMSCCRHKSSGSSDASTSEATEATSSSSGCSGCSGGSCSSCGL